MEFLELFGFLSILHESIKLLPKNGKFMALIAIILCILSSSWLSLFMYTLQSLTFHMLNSTIPDPTSFNPNGPSSFTTNPNQFTDVLNNMKEYLALILAVEIVFFLVSFIISFFSAIATILVSAISYGGNTLSLKDLVSRFQATWKQPLITTLYVSGLVLGYFTFVISLASPLFMYLNSITISVMVLIGSASYILYLYLVVVWILAIVISIVEEGCYGVKALGQAAALVKGKRIHGFMLNLFFSIVVLVISLGYRMSSNKKGMEIGIFGLVVVIVSPLLKIFAWVAYTVLYFQCKKFHGEEIEINGIVRYTKLPTALLANAMP